jgi:hypothetical protein
MKKLLKNIILFLGINVVLMFVGALLFTKYVERNHFQNWETESNLLMEQSNSSKDMLLLGISHARNFSRHHNHERVEGFMQRSMINLGEGEGRGGVLNQYLHLKYFYSQGGETKQVVYFLTPVLLYEHYLDINPLVYEHEPLRPSFFWLNVREGSEDRVEQLFYYVRTKYSVDWRRTVPYAKAAMLDSLIALDSDAIKLGMKEAYVEELNNKTFKQDAAIVEQTVALANAHHSKVLLVIPPALFGRWPGHEATVELMKTLSSKYHCRYLDCSNSVKDPHLYYDHHHLNSRGVEWFVKHVWLPSDSLRTAN